MGLSETLEELRARRVTVRDYLAGQAMNAMIQRLEHEDEPMHYQAFAEKAYRMADAMLEERDK